MSSTVANRHRRRGMALGAALLTAAGVLAGCGGGSSSSSALPSTSGGAAGWLSSIPDTADYRSQIAVNDLHALWTSAGLAFPPTVSQLGHGAGGAASRQIGGGSQIGSALLEYVGANPAPIGYDPLAITSEVSAGEPPHLLSLVQGTIDPSRVGAAMGRLGVRPASTRGIVRYSITNPLELPEEVSGALLDAPNIAVLSRGGRAAAGGSEVPPGDVINLLRGSHPSPSLGSDPDVRQMLGLLNGADVMLFGTSLIAGPGAILGPNASPAQELQLRQKLGLDRLPAAPTFAGYGYLPGHPTGATALAVAIYPNAKDAKGAADVLGNVLRSGTSPRADEPYSQLFGVDSITVHGDAVVARLTEHQGGIITQALQQRDFPLFWSP